MISVNIRRVINCPIDHVFAYMTRFEHDSEWWTGVLETRRLTTEPYGVGTRYWQMNKLLGVRFPTTFEITAYDPPHKLAFHSTSGPLPFVVEYVYEQVGNRTAVTMLSGVEAGNRIFKLAGPLLRLNLQQVTARNFANLARILETHAMEPLSMERGI